MINDRVDLRRPHGRPEFPLLEELGSSLVFILEALASLVLLTLILAILGSWSHWFVRGGKKEIWKQICTWITLIAAMTKR